MLNLRVTSSKLTTSPLCSSPPQPFSRGLSLLLFHSFFSPVDIHSITLSWGPGCHTRRRGEGIKVSSIGPHTLKDSHVRGQSPSNVVSVNNREALCGGAERVGVHARGNKHFVKQLKLCGQDPQNFRVLGGMEQRWLRLYVRNFCGCPWLQAQAASPSHLTMTVLLLDSRGR